MLEFLGAILIVIGAAFIVAALVSKRRANAASSWPTVGGTILKMELVRHVNRSSGITSVSYEPKVEYQYAVMGQPYTGKRLAFGTMRVKEAEGEQIRAKYREGAQVAVHYNPEKPTESLLEQSAMGSGVQLVIGIIMAVMGLALIVISLL